MTRPSSGSMAWRWRDSDFRPTLPADPPFNTTAVYERGNDPWSELVLTNAATLVQPGANVLAIQGWAKAPQLRSEQEDAGVYNIWDFCLDASLGTPPEATGTPGASEFGLRHHRAARRAQHHPRPDLPEILGSDHRDRQNRRPPGRRTGADPLSGVRRRAVSSRPPCRSPIPRSSPTPASRCHPTPHLKTPRTGPPSPWSMTARSPATSRATAFSPPSFRRSRTAALVRYRITAADLGGRQRARPVR